MVERFAIVSLIVTLVVGLTVSDNVQSDGAEVHTVSSSSEWPLFSTMRSAAFGFYDRFLRDFFCSSGPAPGPPPITTQPPPPITTPPPPCPCGNTSRPTMQVAGDYGQDATEFPWHVYILSNGKFCSGALIHPRFILTSASCLRHFNISRPYVGAGIITTTAKNLSEYITGKAHLHPDYRHPNLIFNIHLAIPHDIGYIELDSDLPLTSSVYPICLPTSNTQSSLLSQLVTIVGWGTNVYSPNNGSSSFATLSVLDSSNEPCPTINDTGSSLCISAKLKYGLCILDGGAPISWYDPVGNKAILVGIAGFNTFPCFYDLTAVLVTRVSAYIDWIKNVTGIVSCTL